MNNERRGFIKRAIGGVAGLFGLGAASATSYEHRVIQVPLLSSDTKPVPNPNVTATKFPGTLIYNGVEFGKVSSLWIQQTPIFSPDGNMTYVELSVKATITEEDTKRMNTYKT